MRPSRHLPFWLITLAIFIGLPGYTLIQDGMFMDAMLYTSVAHNEALGWGSFWYPQFSQLNLDLPGVHAFHEQPPLAFGIQSLFFRLFGSSMYVERFYVFFTSCIAAFLIHRLWRLVFRNDKTLAGYSWLPVFFWITIPTVFWTASNNVNENTMGVFILASVLCSWKALNGPGRSWGWIIVSGLLIFLATLSKGFPGFFPLCVPFLYWLCTRKVSFKTGFGYAFLLLLIPALIYLVLFQVEPSKGSLSTYLFKRAFARIASAPTTSNRFQSLIDLFSDLLPQLGLLLIFALIGRVKKVKYQPATGRGLILFFLLTGLAGSAPLMLTMVQKQFYIAPSYPYFAIGLAMIALPYVSAFVGTRSTAAPGFKIFRVISLSLFCGAVLVVAAMKGKTGRDGDILHDIKIVAPLVSQGAALTITDYAFSNDWELQCYLMRYHGISCLHRPATATRFMVIDKREQTDRDMSAYARKEVGLERYDLYELKQ
ncbi:ArnT family glycosyltransferase [Taibaiella koreensis]|uniref:ArnT family glycosyltransferase n=1 Tax=Taibaiella koreensis TaxID=1268548 RepID=UPI000E5A026B|nr:glycosyltransferase family 39 protein [Taibaiella koreensis]